MAQHITDLTLFLSMLGGFVTMSGFLWKIAYDNARTRETIFRRLDSFRKEVDGRLKESDSHHETRFVRKDTCKILHDQGNFNHVRLEQKLDDFIKDVSSKFELLNQNIMALVREHSESNKRGGD